MISCDECSVTTDSKKKLKNHKQSQHPKLVESSSSPDPSPPRKKLERLLITVPEAEVQILDLKKSEFKAQDVGSKTDTEMDFEETETENFFFEKDQQLEAQAKLIYEQAKELKCIKDHNEELLMRINASKAPKIKVSQEVKPIPNHLSLV